jgi:hypothetical protein
MARFARWTINRSGAHVWGLSWPFLAYIELICDRLTNSLSLFAWDCILVRDWELLVHLHPLVILEWLDGTPSKLRWLVTLGGCRLLDSSDVISVEFSVKVEEEPRCWMWGVHAYLAGAVKATLVELRYWVISCQLGSKIKSCLDRGASESLKSTSTWIRGDREITDTTGQNSVSFSSLFTYYFASS